MPRLSWSELEITVAIVWAENTHPAARSAKVESIFKKFNLSAEEIRDSEYTQLLRDFSSGKNWYRGANVDRLTEEEAAIIAVRLVRRIKDKASISDDEANALELAFADFSRRGFSGILQSPEQVARGRLRKIYSKWGVNASMKRMNLPCGRSLI